MGLPKKSFTNLKLAKLSLILIGCILGLNIYNRHIFWPFTTWSMYSGYKPKFPDNTTSALELRVTSKTNQVYNLAMSDPLLMDGDKVTKNLVKNLLNSRNLQQQKIYRNALINLIQDTLPDTDIKNIQVWELKWRVTPLAVPPLKENLPVEKIQRLNLNVAS